MIPKLVYVLNGVEKTHTFDTNQHSTFHQEWEAEEIEYKNPFTREKHWKRWGYYYKATIHYDGIEYLVVDLDLRDFFNKNVTSRKFYPNIDNPNEFYDVDVNDGIAADDLSAGLAYTDIDIVFRGIFCYPTPLNHAVGYWGDRRHTFRFSGPPDNDQWGLGDKTFAELSGFIWKGAWQANIDYVPFDLVSYAGSYYSCILAVNSATTPDVDGSHWTLLPR